MANKSMTLVSLAVGASMLALAGCATRADVQALPTKADLEQLRSDLMGEIAKTQDMVRAAEQKAAEAATAAQNAEQRAAEAADKAEKIFQKSLRK